MKGKRNIKKLFLRSSFLNRVRRIFSSLNRKEFSASMQILQDVLERDGINYSTENMEKYNNDWTNHFKGMSQIVTYPKTAEQVSQLLKYCNESANYSDSGEKIRVTTYGGGTSLVGGSTPKFSNEIVISLEHMRGVRILDSALGFVEVEAGVVLEELNNMLSDYNLVTPYNLGAKGSCTLGGNVATLAGGINFVHYGSLRNYIRGLEVVTGKGDILNLMNSSRKDNTGLDLKQLFIGSEGQFGLITKIALDCQIVKPFSHTCFMRVKGFNNILELHEKAKVAFGSELYSVEYLDFESYKIVLEKLEFLSPFETETQQSPTLKEYWKTQYSQNFKPINDSNREYFLLLEIKGNDQDSLQEKLFEFLETNSDIMEDGILCESETQREIVWNIRENVVLAIMKQGNTLKYDISLPVSNFQQLVDYLREKLQDRQVFCSGYGHIGDGNLHLNVCLDPEKIKDNVNDESNYKMNKVIKKEVDDIVYGFVTKVGGSISAEHGIGQLKGDYLGLQKSEEELGYVRDIKNIFDPNGILNQGKTIF